MKNYEQKPSRARAILATLAICAILACWWFVLNHPDTSIQDNARTYCYMVHANKIDRSVGWPDYLHVYSEQCTADGALR